MSDGITRQSRGFEPRRFDDADKLLLFQVPEGFAGASVSELYGNCLHNDLIVDSWTMPLILRQYTKISAFSPVPVAGLWQPKRSARNRGKKSSRKLITRYTQRPYDCPPGF